MAAIVPGINDFFCAVGMGDVAGVSRQLERDPGLLSAVTDAYSMHVSALIIAAGVGRIEIVKLLLDRGADMEYADDDGFTALTAASVMGRVDVVRLLLDRQADVNHRTKKGDIPLIEAAFNGHVEVVEMLLRHGRQDVDARGEGGGSALWWACEAGRTEVVRILLGREGRACPLLKDQAHGLTPRGIALKKGHAECAEIMQHWEDEYVWRPCHLQKAFSVHLVAEARGRMSSSPVPPYLSERAEAGQPMPRVVVDPGMDAWGRPVMTRRRWREVEDGEEERQAVAKFLVEALPEDLQVQLMAGLTGRGKGLLA